jgi:hypothetical protein
MTLRTEDGRHWSTGNEPVHTKCQCDRHSARCYNEITAEDLLCDTCRPECLLVSRAKRGDKIATHLLEVLADKNCCKACLVYCLYFVPKGESKARHIKDRTR